MPDGGPDARRSGEEDAEARRLRHALYQPHASDIEVEQYRRHVETAAGTSQAVLGGLSGSDDAGADLRESAPSGKRSRAVLVVGGAIAVALAAGAGLWVAGTGSPNGFFGHEPRSAPTVAGRSASPQRSTAAPVAVDRGSREFAAGAATAQPSGGYAYTIASGDTELGIAARFHVCVSDVEGGLPLSMQGNYLQPGTVITLRLASTSVRPDGTVHCAPD